MEGSGRGGSASAVEARGPRSGGSLLARLWWLPVALLAILPSWGTLSAPLVSDDASILGHVHEESGWADWTRPQYGLTTLRFWRPVVSCAWDLQEATTGIEPLPLRSYNLLCHVLAAVLLGAIALRLGCGPGGALVAGAMAGLFPEQGGTLTWISGRTDGTCSPLMLLTVWLALSGRPRVSAASGVAAFVACAAKEMAFVLPVWLVAAAWARGSLNIGRPGEGKWREARRTIAPGLVGVAVALLWRRAVVGSWVGGYPTATDGLVGGAPLAAWTWMQASSWSLWGAALALAAGLAFGCARPRVWAAGMLWACAGAAPLLVLLVDGVLEDTNIRTLRIGDLGLSLAVAGAVAGLRWKSRAGPFLAGFLACGIALLLGWRGWRAWSDTHEWAAAGYVAEARIDAARAVVARSEPSEHPWLREGFPAVWEGAYCLAFGIADRFRAPFPSSPRPVWPARPLFGVPDSRREMLRAGPDGWVRPHDLPLAGLASIAVCGADGGTPGVLVVDGRVLEEPDRSPSVVVEGSFPGAALELIVYTESGYEPAAWPADAAAPSRTLTLREAAACVGFVTIGDALIQTADLRATRAYLEIRAVRDGRAVAASEWLALEWSADVLDGLPR